MSSAVVYCILLYYVVLISSGILYCGVSYSGLQCCGISCSATLYDSIPHCNRLFSGTTRVNVVSVDINAAEPLSAVNVRVNTSALRVGVSAVRVNTSEL